MHSGNVRRTGIENLVSHSLKSYVSYRYPAYRYIKETCVFVKRHPELFQTRAQAFNSRCRGKDELALPKPNLSVFKKNAYYMSMKLFNKLPEHVKVKEDKSFTIEIDKYLMQQCFYSVNEYLSSVT